EPVLRDRGADLHLAVGLADRRELGDARDVDQHRRIDQPQVEHGEERLPAGKHPRVVAVLGEDRDRLLGGVGAHIVERMRLHARPPLFGRGGSAPARKPWMRRGVTGTDTSFTPSASATALAMQTGTLMQLPSARPLAPSGVNGDGDSMCRISTGGISLAGGTK